ncbi:MAG: pentapeptide repeat-containing protein [Candidatus Kapaibacterium sp.]|nr:MAG: pentapeptide repeat-containing protein [Candidatus Kapabacteria bacterium]
MCVSFASYFSSFLSLQHRMMRRIRAYTAEARRRTKQGITVAPKLLRSMRRGAWWQSIILSSPIRTASFIFLVIAVIVISLSLFQNIYSDRNFQINLISEAHGVLFDILILGILMLWLNRLGEKRSEQKKYHEEIDDFRKLESIEAKQRIIGNIRRLNKHGVSKIDLRNCYLAEASLAEANLAGSNLWDADLSGAKMQGADLSATMMPGINFTKAKLMCANLGEANVSGAKLHRVDLWEANLFKANFESSDLSNANLSSANAEQADFSSAILSEATLEGVNFLSANLPGTTMDNANLSGANLENATLWNSNCYNAILFGTDLKNADCSGAVFSNAIMAEADLTDANFSGTDLTNTDLEGANFLNTNLHGADLSGAKLAGAHNLTLEQLVSTRTLVGASMDDNVRALVAEVSPKLFEEKEENK